MNWRAWLARFNARERRLITAAAVVLGLALIKFLVVSPFLAYRESLRDEIAAHRDLLENGRAYLARAGEVARQRDMLRARFKEIREQLVPGDTPTLAAASLQDTLHSLAGEKGVNIQSTQVMREETVGDFRRVAVRITATGELRQLADFLAAVEYGPRRVALPFLEISRRGAVLRGQSGRTLAATVEVSAFLKNAADEAAPPADGVPGAEGVPAAGGEGSTGGASPVAPHAAGEPTGAPSPGAAPPVHAPAASLAPVGASPARTGAERGGPRIDFAGRRPSEHGRGAPARTGA